MKIFQNRYRCVSTAHSFMITAPTTKIVMLVYKQHPNKPSRVNCYIAAHKPINIKSAIPIGYSAEGLLYAFKENSV